VRGPSCSNLLTEFDFFEQPAETWRALLPTITNPLRGGAKKIRVQSTGNGKGSAFHRLLTKPDGAKMRWSKHIVTIYHAVLMGLPVDIEELKEALDDAEGWEQEFECLFVDSSNVLLPYDIIALAESAEASESIGHGFWTDGGTNPVVCGVDFGRSNDPTVCWTYERVGDVWWTREVLVLQSMSTPDQERILRPRIRRAGRTCLDYTGPGIGLGDYLVKDPSIGEYNPSKHQFGKVELCTFTAPFKRELFPKYRRAFESPVKLRIPISTAIREDLHEMKQIVKNGEYFYAAKRTAEGHSDRCTAGALGWRAASSYSGAAMIPIPFPRRSGRADDARQRACMA
jgi:phage FluMu gp28-like protein